MHDTKIEMKIHEEIKTLEEVCKKMMEEFAATIDSTKPEDLPAAGAITDMIKDLAEAKEKIVKACYYKYILWQMEKSEEEDKEEEKFYLRMMKEEHKDELERMRSEYGDEEGERRFYDNYRYRSSGRFAPKGRGSYSPRRGGRRGYEEKMPIPMEYMIDAENYMVYPPEYWRDMDRHGMNRMYYSGSSGNSGSGGNSGGSYGGNSGSGSSGSMGGNSGGNYGGSGGNVRSYSDGYSDGYSEGERNGRKSGSNSRYDRAKRGYEEVKQAHNGNTPEDKQITMKEAEKVLNVVFDEIDEMLEDASPEMKNMVRTKGMSRFQKIQ